MKSIQEISKCYRVNTVPAIKPQQFREDNKEETVKEQVSDCCKVESERQNQCFWPNLPAYCIMHFLESEAIRKLL